ncbi:hypothetical protein CYLTODRAFT_441688, partial [Cylindrobasidium torrendii FP15055 ss-10]
MTSQPFREFQFDAINQICPERWCPKGYVDYEMGVTGKEVSREWREKCARLEAEDDARQAAARAQFTPSTSLTEILLAQPPVPLIVPSFKFEYPLEPPPAPEPTTSSQEPRTKAKPKGKKRGRSEKPAQAPRKHYAKVDQPPLPTAIETLNVHFNEAAYNLLSKTVSGAIGVRITFPGVSDVVWDGTLLFGD